MNNKKIIISVLFLVIISCGFFFLNNKTDKVNIIISNSGIDSSKDNQDVLNKTIERKKFVTNNDVLEIINSTGDILEGSELLNSYKNIISNSGNIDLTDKIFDKVSKGNSEFLLLKLTNICQNFYGNNNKIFEELYDLENKDILDLKSQKNLDYCSLKIFSESQIGCNTYEKDITNILTPLYLSGFNHLDNINQLNDIENRYKLNKSDILFIKLLYRLFSGEIKNNEDCITKN